MKAVVLAGGRGRRLEPYTSVLPKPLMPLGDRAILEITVDRLVASGIRDITLCVGYLAHLIRAVFDGRPRGATLHYVHEERALGTAGPLKLVDHLDETFVALNGDLLTDVDFRALKEHHRRSGSLVTIATHHRTQTLDYGVLTVDGSDPPRLVEYAEKPELPLLVSMGIYVMEPAVLDYIPNGSYFDFPDLVRLLLERNQPVGAYIYDGLWLDIGRREDYERALEAWREDPQLGGA